MNFIKCNYFTAKLQNHEDSANLKLCNNLNIYYIIICFGFNYYAQFFVKLTY